MDDALETAETACGLADALRDRTQVLHTRAERTGIVNRILRGVAERSGYVLLLRNLLPAYRALEAGLERHRLAPGVRCVAEPAVYRARAIQADLETLAGEAWEQSLALLPEGERYAGRISEVAERDAAGLVAHAYVRYLGDLNGGQVLRRILARSLGLQRRELAFYDFAKVPDLDALKAAYRRAFDRAGAELGDTAAILEEAANAFRLNIDLSRAVEGTVSTSRPVTA